MERIKYPILSAGLFFVTLQAGAVPAGSPQDYNLRTKYTCQANGVTVHSKNKLISNGEGFDEIEFTTKPGGNQALSFNDREYMIWPRANRDTFEKSLNLLVRDSSKKYKIMQEIDLGDSQKTKTSMSVTVKDPQGEERMVSCRVELEWLKKTR